MDVFMVQYNPDDEIILHTKNVTHISTAPFQLQQIIDLCPEAQSLIAEIAKTMDEDGELAGYEHLLTRPSAN